MKFALIMGAAFAALTLAASAHSDQARVLMGHHGGGEAWNLDADNDGWVTRSEASAAADRIFDRMDSNGDGRLTGEDRAALHTFDVHVEGPEIEVLEGDGDRRVRVIRRGERDIEIEREAERALREAERRVEEAERHVERAEREAERAEREAERAARLAERHGERHSEHIIVIRGHGRAAAPVAPTPPVAPAPPTFMMLIANSEEADLNGDGALSRDEFRAQHLRFFDASDANGDGRVRFDPPTPPPAPAPPQPPRQR